jgi:long-subunit fatty acid transport protein
VGAVSVNRAAIPVRRVALRNPEVRDQVVLANQVTSAGNNGNYKCIMFCNSEGKIMKTLIVLMTFLVASMTTWAQTPDEAVFLMENETGVGVRAMGMGNAYNAVADDYSATYWNPAGLTMLKYSELSGDISHLKYQNESTYLGNTLLDDKAFTKLNSIGIAYKFPTTRGSFALSFGYNRFKDLDNFMYFSGYSNEPNGLGFELENDNGEYDYYPFDSDVLRTEELTQTGSLGAWSIGGGVMLSENFALGLTVNFYSGSSQYMFDFYQDDIDNLYTEYPANYETYELHQRIDQDFSGWGVKLGGIYHLSKQLRVGLAVDFPSTVNVLETYSSNDVLYFDDGYASEYEEEPGEWEYDIKYPFKFSGGVALDLDLLLLAGSFEYRDWSQVEFDKPDGRSMSFDYQSLLDDNRFFAEDFRAVLSYAAGAELRVPGTGLRLRGGYQHVPSPYVDASEKQDRQYFSAGLGYDVSDGAAFNVGIRQGYWKQNTFDDLTPGGTFEDIETTRVMAGISIRM